MTSNDTREFMCLDAVFHLLDQKYGGQKGLLYYAELMHYYSKIEQSHRSQDHEVMLDSLDTFLKRFKHAKDHPEDEEYSSFLAAADNIKKINNPGYLMSIYVSILLFYLNDLYNAGRDDLFILNLLRYYYIPTLRYYSTFVDVKDVLLLEYLEWEKEHGPFVRE